MTAPDPFRFQAGAVVRRACFPLRPEAARAAHAPLEIAR
ncbi:hypothetical protein ABIE19_002244 [Brevundimonas faecalis]|uniref:Uncharacterized protein n=1 Tax=Brevundimonas faecalis TaxID=947378 RepID=A0ABV2RCJ2_9CAUL